MRKLLLVGIVSVLALGLLAGCAGGVATYTDPAKTINVKVGGEFVIALDSNPTTGFTWQDDHDQGMLKLVEDRYVADEKAEGLVGAGGTQYYHFKALKAGTATVTLDYKRPWEEDSAEQNVFTVKIG